MSHCLPRRHPALAFVALLALACVPHLAPAAEDIPGQSVVVIYNTAFKDSKDVAEYYASKRSVPDKQVIGLKLPTAEVIGRSVYESKLEKPLLKELQARDLIQIVDEIQPATETAPGKVFQTLRESKIRTLVVCYGVPVRTTNDVSTVEPEAAALPEAIRRADAAVDAELTAMPLILAGKPRTGPLANPAYGITNAALLNPLSGLFVVGRLDGPSAALSKALVDRALEAEESGLWGRGYFDIRSTTSPAYKPGDQWISNAWLAVSRYGYDTHLDTQSATLPEGFPLSHVAFYAGWYDNHVSGPFTLPQVEFMPGAVAYHLHSFSAGAIRSTDRTWVGPLVARGVTATMGTVFEPYLDGTPDIGICFARLIYLGFTWGEAALASQRMLSWQTTVIGDPLYRPFRMNALERLKDLAAKKQGRVDWAMTVLYNRRQELTHKLDETIAAIEGEPRVRFSSLLKEKLGDFQRQAGLPEKAATSYREALGLRPSPQQRKRLLWNCAQAFEAANRYEDAYEAYVTFESEVPKPVNPTLLYERLQTLAAGLKKESESRRWGTQLEKFQSQSPNSTNATPTKITPPAAGSEPGNTRPPSKP